MDIPHDCLFWPSVFCHFRACLFNNVLDENTQIFKREKDLPESRRTFQNIAWALAARQKHQIARVFII